MIKEFKSKYILFIFTVVFISGMTIISNNLSNLVYAQDANTSLSTYENSTYGITIKYPHDWAIIGSAGVEDADVDIVTFLSPNQNDNAIVDVHQDKLGNGSINIGSYLSSIISLYKTDLNDFKVIGSNTNSTMVGKNAYKLIYTYTTGDGFKMKDMEIGTMIGNKVYYIIYDGKESLFDKYIPIVQAMIDSFKVTLTNDQR
jgi:eukaryotic-like serine/threonine-protein kinase